MYTKTTWTDKAIQYPQRYYMNTDGGNDKNLLPPFTDWTAYSGTAVVSPYVATINGVAGQYQVIQTPLFPIIPSQAYAFSALGGAIIEINSYNSAGVKTGLVFGAINGSGYFISPSDAVTLEVKFHNNTAPTTFTVTNPQLELGSTATSFTPKKLYTIKQSQGTVTQAGTAVNATSLNNIEQGIFNNLILSIMGAI